MVQCMDGRTLAGFVVSVDGVTFLTAATKPSDCVVTDLMTTTIEQQALIYV